MGIEYDQEEEQKTNKNRMSLAKCHLEFFVQLTCQDVRK